MSVAEQKFIQELDKEIGNRADKQTILADYEAHIYELLNEATIDEENEYEELVARLGSPRDIAELWAQEASITPKKTQWLFVVINSLFFVGGVLLTIFYNVFHWNWLEVLWAGLTEITSIIMLVYIFFWGLLGYEIGKEFGHSGRKLLRKTFMISVIPNVLLMYIITFKLIPYEWFQPLLSVRFIILCIICTALLYPVSMLGYKWGRKTSV
ncbi:hypothetical protein QGM71_18790 [Virgibacillus sp. C22-A2]|uniref:DUF1700 domain-containing protein n=1 Tax=Virgibacillus tibetensis TaxID=3042313 RepID=A0ABU6KJX7_9BACI|nr:hypothetical protein [Virgibacillus sp. C22-A2]